MAELKPLSGEQAKQEQDARKRRAQQIEEAGK